MDGNENPRYGWLAQKAELDSRSGSGVARQELPALASGRREEVENEGGRHELHG